MALIWFLYPVEDVEEPGVDFEDPEESVRSFWSVMDGGEFEELYNVTEDPLNSEVREGFAEMSEEDRDEWRNHFSNNIDIDVEILDVEVTNGEASVDAGISWYYVDLDSNYDFMESYDLVKTEDGWMIVGRDEVGDY